MEIALSPREREVADLVAEGLTNREIADRLVISERTAEGHVEQIRNKLGFHSRTQIAGWVERQRTGPTGPTPRAAARAIAVELPRPIGIEVPRIPRRAVAIGLMVALVAVMAISFWPRSSATALALVAGLGSDGFSGDGGPAVAAQISEPTSLAFDRDGALVFADSYAGSNFAAADALRTRVRRIDAAGVIRSVAGDGYPAQGFATTDSGKFVFIGREARIALGTQGEIYVAIGYAERSEQWIGRIEASGRFIWLAGGNSALGVPPLRRAVLYPRGIAVASDGTPYVSDSGHDVVLAIPAQGEIVTVAGTGQRGSSGDGGPALSATFYAPLSIKFSIDGGLYIADTNNNRVRAIDHGGIIRAVAGDGTPGYGGDGGPATRANLSLPSDLAFGPSGILYIADTGNRRVRAVAPDGTISTVAGPDGLLRPTAVAVAPNGTLFIADAGAHRIYKLTH